MIDASRRGVDGRLTVHAAIVAVLATLLVSIGPSPARAIETDTFRLTPSPLVVQGFERRSFSLDPEPGVTVGDAVRITNTSDEPRRFRIYGADARRDPTTGAVAVDPATAEPRGVGGWVTVEGGELMLDAGVSEVVPFTVTRPTDATVSGLGAVVAEEIVRADDAEMIDVVYRLALLVRLDGDVAGLRVAEPRMDPPVELFPSRSRATVELTNETLEPVRATASFTAAGLTGRFWQLGEQELRLEPGESRELTATWDTVPRWGGLFQPAVEVTWERGSIVRTGPRALHPALWLLALLILIVAVRAIRELRATRVGADNLSEPATLDDVAEPELMAMGDRT